MCDTTEKTVDPPPQREYNPPIPIDIDAIIPTLRHCHIRAGLLWCRETLFGTVAMIFTPPTSYFFTCGAAFASVVFLNQNQPCRDATDASHGDAWSWNSGTPKNIRNMPASP